MPVLVTAATTPLGTRLARTLLDEGGEVRAYCRPGGDAGPLRRAGAFVATGQRTDPGLLEAAMEHVHTVVDLSGGLLSPSAEVVATRAETVAGAAARAGVRRLVALSLPGATTGADDPLRRAKARVEGGLRAAAVPTVVVRTSLVDTAALRAALAGLRLDASVLDRRVAPVRPEDLVELLVAVDALRSRAESGHVVFAADGPETMTLADYLRAAGIGLPGEPDRRIGHRYRPAAAVPLLAPGLDGPWRSDDGRLFDGWEFTGTVPAPVAG